MTAPRRVACFGFALAAAFCLASTGKAKATPVAAEPSQRWTHEESQVGFPASIANFARETVEDSTTSQSDIAVTFRDHANQTLASVYLFRAGIANVSLWQDRIAQQILRPDGPLGTIDRAKGTETPFTPAGGGSQSGSRLVFPVSGKANTATGSAVLAVDQWLVAIRMTSRTLSPTALDSQLASFVDALVLPRAKVPAEPVYRITECTTPPLPTKAAKRADVGLGSMLVRSTLQMTSKKAEDDRKSSIRSFVLFCRAASGTPTFGAYRIDQNRNRYIVAFGDAGVVAVIEPDSSTELMGEGKTMGLTLITTEQNLFFRGFRSLPAMEQVLSVVDTENPIGGTGRTAKNSSTINISPSGK